MLFRCLVLKLKMNLYCSSLVIFVINFERTVFLMSPSPELDIRSEKFNVNGKQLEEVPEGNNSIAILDLAYNHLSALPMNIFQNKSFKDLTILDLHQNRIDNVSCSAFHGLRRLKDVDISFNQITALDPYTFEHNRRMEKLDLTKNKIKFTKSEVFLVSPSMQILILRNNDIDQLYELTFVGLKHLTSLILDDNFLNIIHSNSLKPLIDLEFLSLAHTRVMHLKTSMFTRVPRVIEIKSTPLASKFDPPLARIKKEQVTTLLEAESN